jgi:hypothetical protein
MKQKPLFIVMIVVFLFLLLGASAFALKSYNDAKAQKAQRDLEMLQAPKNEKANQKPLVAVNEEAKAKGSLFDIFNKGQNVMCTINSADPNNKLDGTIYVSGKKMNGRFTVEVADKPMVSNVVSDGEFMYMWSDLLPQGIKMELSKVEEQAKADPTSLSKEEMENLKTFQQMYEYSCEEWDVDENLFNEPRGVTFMDFSDVNPAGLMNGGNANGADENGMGDGEGQGQGQGAPSNMCSSCALIPDPEAKAACLTNFKCN